MDYFYIFPMDLAASLGHLFEDGFVVLLILLVPPKVQILLRFCKIFYRQPNANAIQTPKQKQS